MTFSLPTSSWFAKLPEVMTTANLKTTPSKNWIHIWPWNFAIQNCLDLFRAPIGLGTFSSQIYKASVQFQIKIQKKKTSRRRSHSPKYAELNYFTLLFCRGRLRNVQRFIMHVHSHCSYQWRSRCRHSRGLLKLSNTETKSHRFSSSFSFWWRKLLYQNNDKFITVLFYIF